MEFNYTQTDLPKIAKQIIDSATSKIFLFYADMGVGKTTLIKEILKQLGVKEFSGSPTFSIVNEYELANGFIYHFDFYRINNIEEAYDIGLEDYLDGGHYIFVEWPEKVKGLLPQNSMEIIINKNINGSRTLTMMPVN